MKAPHITYQFKGRRKPEEFILYPRKADQPVMFQSDKSIGFVDIETGKGKIYLGRGEHPSSVYLSTVPVANMPADLVELIKAAMPKPGTTISLSGVCEVQY